MRICKKLSVIFIFFINAAFIFAQSLDSGQNQQQLIYSKQQQKLRITAENVKLFPDKVNGGFHLYVKKTRNVNSIILTETTKDPSGKNDNYAYRAKSYNPVNGDEIRILDGKKLTSKSAKYSLVDSTTEITDFMGEAFHIYIPETIVYGYEWSRHGEIKIGKGTFINIRSFEKPYADYSGEYMDSPFMFDLKTFKRQEQESPAPIAEVTKQANETPKVSEAPKALKMPEQSKSEESIEIVVYDEENEAILTDDYNPSASEKFKEMSGDVIYSKGPKTIIKDIESLLNDENDNVDIVFAIDATGSMKNDIEQLKKEMVPMLLSKLGKNTKARIGLLFYRDYEDSFNYRNLPVKIYQFTSDFDLFGANLCSIKILGIEGGDIPEAVYEAMYAACVFFKWRPNSVKKIILIGDAEPHPFPRGSGKYSKNYVMKIAKAKNIAIRTILLPKD